MSFFLRVLKRIRQPRGARRQILFRTHSGRDPLIVMERGGVRHLIIGRRTHSAYQPSRPERIVHLYPRLMLAAFAAWRGHAERRPGRVLILGLGAGIIPRHLAKTYPYLHQVSVDVDPMIHQAAVRFFDFPSWLPVTIEDGVRYLAHNCVDYDAVFLDVFDGSYVPPQFLSREFLNLCAHRLRTNALFISNLYEGSATRNEESALWKEAFPNAIEIRNPERLRGNRIVVAGPGVPAGVDAFRNAAAETLSRQGVAAAEVQRLLRRTMPIQLDS